MYTDKITIQFGPDNEWLTIHCAGGVYSPSLKSNKKGYMLTCLLNTDFERAAIAVEKYGKDCGMSHSVDGFSIPVNTDTVFRELLSISEAFHLYHPFEWFSLSHRFRSITGSTATNIKRLRDYLDLCNNEHIPYTGGFYDFLCAQFYFGPANAVSEEEIEFRHVMAESENGELIPELEKLYRLYSEERSLPPSKTYNINCTERFIQVALASLQEVSDSGKTVRRCENCGRYFIPENRSDTLYCDNPSPEVPEMTCKEYGTRRLWYERQKEDEIATLSRKIASAKGMLAKRNPDRPEYAAYYEYFKEQRRIWIKAVKDGTKTPEEYKKWLLYMKEYNNLKAAGICNCGE